MTDFPSLIRLLAQHDIEFILIGGAAAIAHGSARLTQDLDIVYRRTAENIARLAVCLDPYHPYLRDAPPGLPFRLDAETIQRGLNFTLTTDLGALDLFGKISGGGTYEALQRDAIEIKLFGVTCRCLGLRRLIEVKRAAGRPRDLEAIAELQALLDESEGPVPNPPDSP
jgi:predicted nucleotidyltransferase